MNFEILELTRF